MRGTPFMELSGRADYGLFLGGAAGHDLLQVTCFCQKSRKNVKDSQPILVRVASFSHSHREPPRIIINVRSDDQVNGINPSDEKNTHQGEIGTFRFQRRGSSCITA
jgi:hypothetical protein